MDEATHSALTSAADTRRRELPAAVALVILTGGLAAAIIDEMMPVVWAATMALVLILDAELYRRLDVAEAKLEGRTVFLLAAWAFITSAFYAVLPAALWLDGEPAGAAAAMVLWVAGVVRHFNNNSGRVGIALAGAAPPALSLLIAPLAMAAASLRADWDLAVIAAVGGGALMVYVAQARMSASEAEAGLRRAADSENLQHTLAQLLFDQGALPAFLIDRDERIVAMSSRINGVSPKKAIGRRFDTVRPWTESLWRTAFAAALKGATTTHVNDEIATPDGVRWHEWEARPWRGADGAIAGVIAHGRDITALVRARREAAANEERLRIALNAGRGLVWEMDLKQRKLKFSGDPLEIYGTALTFEQFRAETMPLLYDVDRETIRANYESTLAGEIDSFEHRMKRANGDTAWNQVWLRPVRDDTGAMIAVIGLTKDISERKHQEAAFIAAMSQAEQALKQKRALLADAKPDDPMQTAERRDVSVAEMFQHLRGILVEMDARDIVLADTLASLRAAREAAENASLSKSNFLASMSHELRTPLNAIIGYSEILQEEAETDGRDSDIKDLDRVLTSARQLLHLINDILDLSKIEAGRMDISISGFETRDLIEDAIAMTKPAMEKNGNTLNVAIAEDIGAVRSDPFKLNQCLLNLLSNAAKFTKDGVISVAASRRVEASGDWIEIAVADSGIGMNEEQVARLFTAFVQADATTARNFGGTGLGLAITQRVMRMLGGDVIVASIEGKGSTFTLKLPAMMREGAAPTKPETSGLAHGQGRLALVIDDEGSARDLASRALTRLGFTVREAAGGVHGIELARALQPSVILLDINLPDVSGWDVLAALKADATATIPVIVHSVDDNRQRSISLGACEHIRKPADRDVLAAAALRFVRPDNTSAPADRPAQPFAKTA